MLKINKIIHLTAGANLGEYARRGGNLASQQIFSACCYEP